MIDGIFEFTYRPRANKKNANGVFVFALALALVVVVASVTAEKFKGVISLAAVILICWAIYIFTRFVIPEYAYALIYDAAGIPNLIVTKRIGKGVTTLFNMPISYIYDIKCEISRELGNRKTPYGTKKYSFCATMLPSVYHRIFARGHGEEYEITLELTEEVSAKLLEYAAIAKAYEGAE